MTYALRNNALVDEMLADAFDQLHLLVWSEPCDGCFDDASQRHFVQCDETVIIHVGEKAHDELAIHAVSDTAVSGDRIAEIFDLESAFKTRGKETTERSDEGCESGKSEDVNLHGCHLDRLVIWEPDW